MKYIKTFENRIISEFYEDILDIFIDLRQDNSLLFFHKRFKNKIRIGITSKSDFIDLTQEIIDCIIQAKSYTESSGYVFDCYFNSETNNNWEEIFIIRDLLLNNNGEELNSNTNITSFKLIFEFNPNII
jgi:hypothetical protein